MEEQYLKSLEQHARQTKGILEAIGFFLLYTTVTGIIGLAFGIFGALTGESWVFLLVFVVGVFQLLIIALSVSMFNDARKGKAVFGELPSGPSNTGSRSEKYIDCTKCGKQPEPNHDYCTNCGTRHEVRPQ